MYSSRGWQKSLHCQSNIDGNPSEQELFTLTTQRQFYSRYKAKYQNQALWMNASTYILSSSGWRSSSRGASCSGRAGFPPYQLYSSSTPIFQPEGSLFSTTSRKYHLEASSLMNPSSSGLTASRYIADSGKVPLSSRICNRSNKSKPQIPGRYSS